MCRRRHRSRLGHHRRFIILGARHLCLDERCSTGERDRRDHRGGSPTFRDEGRGTQHPVGATVDQHDLGCAASDTQRVERCHQFDARRQVRLRDEQDLVEHPRRVDGGTCDDLRQRDEKYVNVGGQHRRERDQGLECLQAVSSRTGDREAAAIGIGDDVSEWFTVADDFEYPGGVGGSCGQIDDQDARPVVGQRLAERPCPTHCGCCIASDGGEPEVQRAARGLNTAHRRREVGDIERRRGLGQERDELATARADVARPANTHVKCVKGEGESEPYGQRGHTDEPTHERSGWDESG